MKISRRPPPQPYIPFISLADIAWQIIIFFLVAATFPQSESLKLALPSSGGETAAKESTTVSVQAAENSLQVNNQSVLLGDLAAKIKSLLAAAKTDNDRIVTVLAADDLTFQRHADILYAIQLAGGVVVIADGTKAGDAKAGDARP